LETGNKYLYTKAYYKIRDLIMSNPEETVFVICGGQGASKTVSIIQLIIQSLVSSDKEATVLSSELSKMKKTVIRDYKKIAKDWGTIQDDSDFNRSESKHEYPNGSYIDFLGADVSDLGKGFRRDILYINEADKLDIDSAIQFISRAGITIIDYNPDRMFWGDEFINEDNYLRLTFEDNEYLSKSEIKSILEYKVKGFYNTELPQETLFTEANIKSKYWSNRWKVYGCGIIGQLDGVVFENWHEIDTIPEDARKVCTGVDFGFSVSKFAALDIYKKDGAYYLKEIVYSTQLSNAKAARAMFQNGYTDDTVAYCDYAEPKSIADLKSYGIRATECESKRDIKDYAIQKLDENSIFIEKGSTNLISEIKEWVYDPKTGKPQKSNNDHLMDALCYGVGSEGKYDGSYY
jgi:phage terminase large subunit